MSTGGMGQGEGGEAATGGGVIDVMREHAKCLRTAKIVGNGEFSVYKEQCAQYAPIAYSRWQRLWATLSGKTLYQPEIPVMCTWDIRNADYFISRSWWRCMTWEIKNATPPSATPPS